ncbi:hypothetical protein CBM2592_A40051 [Cupriavidus taiwanensis]|nr:hypothetical protein CBM2588_A20058 [Cupriavidus taiwanensis]SOY54047.1 hypothetical protein CBM2592_A40051 [Cupriavidus taiwanensis]SOY84104.1 hypothetical protein CBM2591_A30058 [Cupriavidus taiwanensis]SOZ58698.1 hypothetical protein CBM2617_A30059 [Cupriavidus taiwanensis]SOZ81239.1 hypothetical protein CBM2618_A40051 [Cupriavidus taiwanensis]
MQRAWESSGDGVPGQGILVVGGFYYCGEGGGWGAILHWGWSLLVTCCRHLNRWVPPCWAGHFLAERQKVTKKRVYGPAGGMFIVVCLGGFVRGGASSHSGTACRGGARPWQGRWKDG